MREGGRGRPTQTRVHAIPGALVPSEPGDGLELPLGRLRVPGDARKLLFAGVPFGAGENARGDVDQAWD